MSIRAEVVADHIINWLSDYARGAGVDGFVVGVSGGIDSAVTATLCARTGLKTTLVNMPIHQAQTEFERSNELISQLVAHHDSVNGIEVDLTTTYDTFVEALPEAEDLSGGLALANTRARLRMTALYSVAAQRRSLVVGTGNKIEDFGIGFYTKYGDGGVDLSPIADLVKSEVYALGEFLGVPKSIQEAAPTDGLWGDERNDEDQIGASYPELELAMEQDSLIEKGQLSVSSLEGREAEVYAIYKRLNTANQHKMKPIPVCEIPR